MKLKQFIFALVAMLFGFSVTASAEQLLVNCDYNSSTEGYGTTKFSDYAGAYAYATANGKTSATIVIEKTNTLVLPVAQIGTEKYATLAEAVDVATAGQTITLIADIQLTEMVTIPEGKELTLDLNGKTVNSGFNGTSTTNHIYALSNKGTLTINDSKGNGSINSRGIYNYGTLTLDAGAINAIDGNGGYAVNNQSGSTFVMNGGVVAATNEDDHQSSSGGGDATALKVPAGCTATLNGGTINNVCDFTYAIEAKGTLNIPETSTIKVNGTHGAIYVNGGETIINAGTYTIPKDNYSRTDNVLYVSGGSLVVNGGTFIGDSDTASGGSCLWDAAGKAVVNGGTFKGSSGGDVWGTTGTTIKGGKFENLTETKHIAPGYELKDGTVVEKKVAEINGVKYATLAAAVAAAQEGETITLIDNVVLAERVTIPADKTLTIDLNGKSISMEESIIATAYAINNLGNLTIKDGVGGGSVNARGMYNGYGNGGENVASATMTILGGTFNAMGTNGGAAIFNYGTANVNAGTFTSIGGYSLNNQAGSTMTIAVGVSANNGVYNSNATLTINGGEISGNRSGCHVIYAWNSTLTINGGEFYNNNSGNATIMSAGTSVVTINGGTFGIKDGRVPGNSNTWTSCLTDVANTAQIIVNGGTLNGGFRVQAGTSMTINGGSFNDVYGSNYNIYGTVTVTGGTFTDDTAKTFASKHIAAGYELNADGTVAVKPVAEVNGVKYASFAEAVAAAQAGDEIKLLANVTVEGTLALPAGIKLTSNGHTINGSIRMLGDLTLNGPLTITGGLWVGKSGETLTATLSGDKLTASYFMFQRGTYTINADIDAVYGYLSFEGTFEVNSTIHTTGTNGEVLYINGNVTLNDKAVLDSDNSVFVNNDNAVLTLKPGSKVDSNVNITTSGAKLNIDATGMTAGASANITGTVTNSGNGTIAVVGNDKLEAQIVNGKIVLVAKVAKIGENTYRTLAQAVAAVEDGGTITLIANETFTKNNRYNNGGWWDGLGYSGDKSFTIDLAGFTISQDGALNDYLMWFKNDGAKANTITLKNGTLDAGTSAYCALATASSNVQKITVNLENIQLINNNSSGATLKIRGGAELNAKAGTIITGQNSYLGIEAVGKTTVVNIYEGAEIYQNGTSSYCGCLAGVSGNGTINVYGGEGQSKSGGFIAMTSGGTINIKGGEWTANTDGTYANGNKSVLVAQSDKGAKSIVNVTGGTFKGGYNCYGNAAGDAQINISGGNFNANPTSYVAENYVAVENNGVWTVVKVAAKIGDVCYETALKALENAKDNETVTFLDGTHILGDLTHVHFRANGDKSPINLTIQGEEGKTVVVDKFYFNTIAFPENLTIKNITIDGNDSGAQQGISSHTAVTGLTVENCTFKNGAFISLADQLATNVTVKNNSFDGTGVDKSTAVYVQKANGLTVTGNTITGGFYNAVQCSSEAADITIDGNTINGTNDRALRFGTVKGAVAITNNKFYDATDDASELLKATKVDGGSIVFTGNTYDGNPWNPATINSGDNVVAVVSFVATVNGVKYATLAEAIAASTPETGWVGEVTLLKDVTLEGGYADAGEGLRIEKSVTINGGGYTIDCGKFTKGIRIYQNGDDASNVMFKNINIVNNNYQGRCIDTRSAKINLMLNGGVNLTAHGTNSQPLTIGGSEAMTKVTISGGTIDAGTSGYAVICFVPVTNHINVQGNAVIKGLAAFYLKEGVTNTAIKLSQSTSIGTNKYAAASGDFGAIVIEGSNNGVRLEHSGAVVKAVAADGAEMAAQAAFLLRGNNNTVGYYNADAQVVTEGGQAYWTLSKADVTGTKYERNGVEMLLEAETRGYQFITVEDALRYAKNGDTVKLLANAELDETYVNEKSLTLDLNGKTLSTAFVAGSTTNHLYAIHNYGELTITDSSDAKAGKISARGNFNYGTLTLEAGTIEAIDGNGGYAVRNYAGSFTMNGGTIATTLEDDNKVDKGGYDATTVRVDEGATFTMNGGVINNICDYTFAIENYGTTTVKGGKATSVHTTVANYGTIKIEGGVFVCNGIEGITAHALWAAAGETKISGGTFDGKDNYNGFNVCASKGANVVIKGGNFLDVHSGSLYGDGTITVSGGTFFDKISDQRCELGFQAVANTEGTYDVKRTDKREAYTIVDGDMTEFVNEKNIEVGTLTYKRTFNNANWQALYLPFEVPVSALSDQFDITYIYDVHTEVDEQTYEPTGRTYVEQVRVKSGTLQANYPYLIRRKADADKELVLTLTNATLCKAVETTIDCSSVLRLYEVTGTYHKMTPENGLLGMWALKSGVWERATESSYLNPFRVYIKITDRAGVPVDLEVNSVRMFIRGEEEVTGINGTKFDTQGENFIYDLQGRRVANPVKGGIYIINGKKVYYNK